MCWKWIGELLVGMWNLKLWEWVRGYLGRVSVEGSLGRSFGGFKRLEVSYKEEDLVEGDCFGKLRKESMSRRRVWLVVVREVS